MARKTLRDELEEAKRSAEYQRGRAEVNQSAREQLDKHSRNQMDGFAEEWKRNRETVDKLFEIIRWHLNPRTAEFPFAAEKDQRNPNDFNPKY